MTVANMTDYLDDLRAFSVSQEEPQWMLDLRIQMLEKIDGLDLPFIERVKINRWPLLDVTRPEHIVSEGNLNAFNILDEAKDNGMVIQYGQTTVMEQLPMDLTEQGVIFTDIFTAMREHSELVKEAYMQYAVKADEDKMTAFHAAFMNSGLFLYVPKNVVIEEPLEAIFIQDSTRIQNFVKHVLVLAETNSEFSYVEKFYKIGRAHV